MFSLILTYVKKKKLFKTIKILNAPLYTVLIELVGLLAMAFTKIKILSVYENKLLPELIAPAL